MVKIAKLRTVAGGTMPGSMSPLPKPPPVKRKKRAKRKKK